MQSLHRNRARLACISTQLIDQARGFLLQRGNVILRGVDIAGLALARALALSQRQQHLPVPSAAPPLPQAPRPHKHFQQPQLLDETSRWG